MPGLEHNRPTSVFPPRPGNPHQRLRTLSGPGGRARRPLLPSDSTMVRCGNRHLYSRPAGQPRDRLRPVRLHPLSASATSLANRSRRTLPAATGKRVTVSSISTCRDVPHPALSLDAGGEVEFLSWYQTACLHPPLSFTLSSCHFVTLL